LTAQVGTAVHSEHVMITISDIKQGPFKESWTLDFKKKKKKKKELCPSKPKSSKD
jgi:hypothetical protein